MARKKKGRALDGVVILDKPQGMTSNGALQKLRWLFNAQKAGHTGSLDPLATGVLPICLGEATKFSQYLLDADKGYFTTASLGDIRDTGDSEGQCVETRPVPSLSEAELNAILDGFKGAVEQVPSMFSALKHEGRPLYEWARKGITIDRPARSIVIRRLELTALRDAQFDLSVECSKGTYIRSLVEDIGLKIGCGAHVSMLRRFKAGHFDLGQAISLQALEELAQRDSRDEIDREIDRFILPVDSLLPNLYKVSLNNCLARSILHGQAVRIADFEKPGLARVYTEASASEPERFIGVADIAAGGTLTPKRLMSIDPRSIANGNASE